MAVDVTLLNSNSLTNIQTNFDRVEEALQEALGRNGDTPNSMNADIDMDGNDVLNVNRIDVQEFYMDGQPIASIPGFEAIVAIAPQIIEVAAISDEIVDVSNNLTSIDLVGVNIASVNTVAANIIDVNTVAANIADINVVVDNIVDIQNAEENAAATAADRVQTGLDRIATAADRVQTGLDASAAAASAASLNPSDFPWLSKSIGEPFPLWDHITGCPLPTNTANHTFIKLTASDAFNTGLLTSESVTGSAPLVVATAVISVSGSPINGQTVSLINTERRFLRAGAAGTVENDQLQDFQILVPFRAAGATFTGGGGGGPPAEVGASTSVGPTVSGANGTPRTGNETRGKNIGITYYMRVK